MAVACFCGCDKRICDLFICSTLALLAVIELILLCMLLLFCLSALPSCDDCTVTKDRSVWPQSRAHM